MHLLLQACFVLAVLPHSDARNFPLCETDFKCFIPAKDKDEEYKVKLRTVYAEEIPAESTAIVMIHAYNEKHFDVVFEGLKDDIVSIEFSRIPKNQIKEILFTCSIEEENGSRQIVSKFRGKVKERKELTNPLKCKIEAKSGSPIVEKGIKEEFVLDIIRNIGGTLTPIAFDKNIVTNMFFFCDPTQLKVKLAKSRKNQAYKKITMQSNKPYCSDKYNPDDIYGSYDYIEYREGESTEYVKANIGCAGDSNAGKKRFHLSFSGRQKMLDSDIDIRCVGNASFFCDYNPKYMPGKEPMIRTKPNKTLGIPSKIECPNSHPFFVIKGRAPLSKEYSKFECLNYKGEMMWTVEDDIISKTDPEVYCTDEKECDTVPSSFLHAGSFINEENLPACHEGGQLWINKESADKCLSEDKKGKCTKITKFSCNKRIGNLTYHVKHTEELFKFVDGYHIFCDYPKTAQQVNKRHANTIIISATVSAVGTFIVTSVIMFFVLRRIHKRRLYEMDKLKKAYEAEAQILRNPNFDPSDIEAKSNKSKRDSVKSGKGTITTRSSIAEKDKSTAKDQLSVKEKGRGFFTEKNERPLVEIEAPKGLSREIKKAYEKNTKYRVRNDGLPKGYKKEYNEETRGVMQKIIKALHESNGYDNLRALITYGREQFMIRQKKEEEQMKKDLAQKKNREHKKKSKSKKK